MKRREFLQQIGLLSGYCAVGSSLAWLQSCSHNMEAMTSGPIPVLEGPFTTVLPPLPQQQAIQTSLRVQQTTHTIKTTSTAVLGYHNTMLGPVLRARRGETVQIQCNNGLAEATNIHWHGLVIPSEMDGHPDDSIAAGGMFTYSFTVQQRAGTYWYHPHVHGTTAKQVYNGLAGFFLVADAEEEQLGLPSGEYELPLVIQDKRCSPQGNIYYNPTPAEIMTGFMGETVLVNGVFAPVKQVQNRWYRLRLLNGSTARIYNIALSDNSTFHIIGSDGGLLAAPVSAQQIMLAPGERADILIDFSRYSVGAEVFLCSTTFSGDKVQGVQQFNILKYSVIAGNQDSFQLPSSLSTLDFPSEGQSIRTRQFDIQNAGHGGGHAGHGGTNMHSINGKVYSMSRIDESVRAGDTEIWVFDNTLGQESHPMHIHGIQCKVLDRVGGRATLIPTEQGWKDTVLCMPGEKVRVLIRFPEYKGKYVFHCHNLEHEDDGMMLNYQIM